MSDILSSRQTALQSLVKCLDQRIIEPDTVCSHARVWQAACLLYLACQAVSEHSSVHEGCPWWVKTVQRFGFGYVTFIHSIIIAYSYRAMPESGCEVDLGQAHVHLLVSWQSTGSCVSKSINILDVLRSNSAVISIDHQCLVGKMNLRTNLSRELQHTCAHIRGCVGLCHQNGDIYCCHSSDSSSARSQCELSYLHKKRQGVLSAVLLAVWIALLVPYCSYSRHASTYIVCGLSISQVHSMSVGWLS